MFKITKDGATVAMTEAPNYIKQAENGCFVLISKTCLNKKNTVIP